MESELDRWGWAGLIICLVFIITIITLINISPIINNPSAQSFITICNNIYGEGNWSVYQLNPWTTYSDEFWDTHPRVYMNMGVVDNNPYSCFDRGYNNGT